MTGGSGKVATGQIEDSPVADEERALRGGTRRENEGRTTVRPMNEQEGGRRRWPRLVGFLTGAILVGAIGLVVLLVVNGMTGGGGEGGTEPEVETPSDVGGEPFDGGPRLHFPVDEIDMGQVPLNTNVSDAFSVMNVGNAAVEIQNVEVSAVEGC